jgi:polygalacturonase
MTPTKSDAQGTYINVEDFGAIGDGKTDDTFAIQKAIKYAFDNGVKRLIFQPKTYLLNKKMVRIQS